MTDMTPFLDYWLGRCYEFEVIRGDKTGSSINEFSTRLQADQNLMNAAKDRLAGITDDLTKQCYITKEHRRFLQQAIALSLNIDQQN